MLLNHANLQKKKIAYKCITPSVLFEDMIFTVHLASCTFMYFSSNGSWVHAHTIALKTLALVRAEQPIWNKDNKISYYIFMVYLFLQDQINGAQLPGAAMEQGTHRLNSTA